MRRLMALFTVLAVGCGGGGGRSQVPIPGTMNDALGQFLDAARANDTHKMSRVWGTARGPASEWMSDSVLMMRMTVVQRYMNANGYRIVEGPLAVPGHADRRLFRVELQRAVDTLQFEARPGRLLEQPVHLRRCLR